MPARGYQFYLRVFNLSKRSELVRYRIERGYTILFSI